MVPRSTVPRSGSAFLAGGAAKRLHLERLPGYAPDLNPQEGVWNAAQTRSSWKTCVACISLTCARLSCGPKNAFAIGARASNRVFFTHWEDFRKLCRDQ